MHATNGRISSLDFLRTFAVLWVVATHAHSFAEGGFLDRFSTWGALGVDLFFVLSGYLIASQWIGELQAGDASIRNFFIKRTFRIWPNYFFLLALFLAFPALKGGSFEHPWRYFLFVQNLYPAAGFPTTWSLCIEEHFYLVFPFAALWAWRARGVRPAWVIVALLAASVALRLVLWISVRPDQLWLQSASLAEDAYYNFFYRPTFARLDGLLFGVSIAAVERTRPQWWARWQKGGAWWLALAAAILLGTVALGSNTLARHLPSALLASGAPAARGLLPMAFSVLGLDLAFACILMAALCRNSFFGRLRFPFAEKTALFSFAIYLTHPNVIDLLAEHFPYWGIPARGWLATLLIFGGSYAAAAALYYSVERPFMRWRRHFLRRAEPANLSADNREPAAVN